MLKLEFINSILAYWCVFPKMQFPNFGNCCSETERSQTTHSNADLANSPLDFVIR